MYEQYYHCRSNHMIRGVESLFNYSCIFRVRLDIVWNLRFDLRFNLVPWILRFDLGFKFPLQQSKNLYSTGDFFYLSLILTFDHRFDLVEIGIMTRPKLILFKKLASIVLQNIHHQFK